MRAVLFSSRPFSTNFQIVLVKLLHDDVVPLWMCIGWVVTRNAHFLRTIFYMLTLFSNVTTYNKVTILGVLLALALCTL